MLNEGDLGPEGIELEDQDGNLINLDDLKGTKICLYTYPKDSTPGCTIEAKNFRDSISKYKKAGIKIFGVSADSVQSHKKFALKHNLPFTLLSDPKKILLNLLGSLEGGKIKRRTWLIDENWKIEKLYEKVSPIKHDKEVCEFYSLK